MIYILFRMFTIFVTVNKFILIYFNNYINLCILEIDNHIV